MNCEKCNSPDMHFVFEYSEAICKVHTRCVICKHVEHEEFSCWHGYEKFNDCPRCFLYKKLATGEWPIVEEDMV
jgi:hypothetical protein